MEELIKQIDEVQENECVRLSDDLIMWKEGSAYDLEVTSRQFDDLERLLNEQPGKTNYFVDLSLARRPDPAMVQLIETRVKTLKDRFEHVAVFTGKNHLMYIGIKFYFIRFDFNSYSAHARITSALKSFS